MLSLLESEGQGPGWLHSAGPLVVPHPLCPPRAPPRACTAVPLAGAYRNRQGSLLPPWRVGERKAGLTITSCNGGPAPLWHTDGGGRSDPFSPSAMCV